MVVDAPQPGSSKKLPSLDGARPINSESLLNDRPTDIEINGIVG